MSQEQRFISLEPLYRFVEKYKDETYPLGKDRSRGKGTTQIGKDYGQLCSDLTNAIDAGQGFYLWGLYDPEKRYYWRSKYLGKAGFLKTASLQARIREELKDECWFVWRRVYPEQRVLEMCEECFPGGRYRTNCARALLKTGTTHIIWVPAPFVPREEIIMVEADLIEALDPEANLMRPTPAKTVQEHAAKIFEGFRRTIHAARPTKTPKGRASFSSV